MLLENTICFIGKKYGFSLPLPLTEPEYVHHLDGIQFGVAFVAIGWALRKRGDGNGTSHRNTSTALLLALSVMVAGPIAALPPKDVSTVMVFFKPGTPGVEIFRAIDVPDSRIIWASASGNMWPWICRIKRKSISFISMALI